MPPRPRHGYSYGHRYFPGKAAIWGFVARHSGVLRGRILDLGGGSRPFRPLVAPGASYLALDLDRVRRPDVVADAVRLPFGNAVFEAVLCTEVLEHVYETREVLAEIERVLAPGGTLLLSVPFGWGLHYVPNDFYRFTPFALGRLLSEANLLVEEQERLGGIASMVYARLSDVAYDLADRWLAGIGLSERLRAGLFRRLWAVPNLLAFHLCPFGDRLHPADALQFAIVARKAAC